MIALTGDIGGTRIKLAVVRDGQIIARQIEPALADQRWPDRLPALAATWRALCHEANIELATVAGLGVGFPSLVDAARGRILDEWGKFPGCAGFDFGAWARDTLGLPLALDNDARAALIGEWRQGAGRGSNDVVMVTLGTGIGVGVVMQGRVLRGAHGQAGTLGGHLTVRYGGRPCICGNVGCAEAEASTAVLRELAALRPEFATSALARETELDYASVFQLAEAGDACALALRDHSLGVWSATIVNLIHAYDPERVIVGGGIMRSSAHILPALQHYVNTHAHTAWGRVQLVAGELGDDAALLGGAWLVNEKNFPNASA
ncbi:ROK family protein [Oleiharenicola lentus]|uniref:ROK family protein n=1 Tax=Oleiharenicola lentus TaxID=2508720 RepID=UPI003F671AC3